MVKKLKIPCAWPFGAATCTESVQPTLADGTLEGLIGREKGDLNGSDCAEVIAGGESMKKGRLCRS